MSLNLKSLVGKLTDTSRRALEGAVGVCVSRTHYEVEMEHWVSAMAEAPDGDVARILRDADLSPERFLAGLGTALDGFKTGNSRRPDLSESIAELTRDGWLLASIEYQHSRVRTGALFLAVLRNAILRRRLLEAVPEVAAMSVDVLQRDLPEITSGAPEDREVFADAGAAQRAVGGEGGKTAATPALDRFTLDLTAAARADRIDPVLGRDAEIRQIVDILMRRRQNNPILTGEAGVGKTAVVEGFARRIAAGDVPEPLAGVAVRSLDLGLLQAGASVKGEFENRLKQVIEEVQASQIPVILFIDEAHMLIGAGGAEGQGDAANLLKPALARGELRTIAATTWSEYKKYIEKDPALTRRFQVVKVEEPDDVRAIDMMRALAPKLEAHHGVRITDEALTDAVRLSHRYIPARQLPDKCVSVLDTASARVAVGRAAVPADVEDRRRRIESIDRELEVLAREAHLGADNATSVARAKKERAALSEALESVETRWARERELVTEILETRQNLHALAGEEPDAEGGDRNGSDGEGEARDAAPEVGDADALRRRLAELDEERRRIGGDEPLVQVDVDAQTIAGVISSWTGIPVGRMLADEIRTVLGLAGHLGARVLGQDHALEAISRRIWTSRAKLENPTKPAGVFMLVGPSGVGKTETALSLAEALYGGERNAVTINMSEYQESHTVSSLKGSPPGYVGYGEGGVLTEAVRRRPYSVVLLDEVEKAHPDVMELFFQVFDKGVLEDGEGREVDFKNTIILLTSNVGSETILEMCRRAETLPDPDRVADAVRPELLRAFPAALLGRLVVVPYYPVMGEVLARIIRLQLDRVARRIAEHHGAELVYDDEIVEAVAKRCTESESGARNIDAILTRSVLPSVSGEVLSRMADGRAFTRVEIGVGESGDFRYTVA